MRFPGRVPYQRTSEGLSLLIKRTRESTGASESKIGGTWVLTFRTPSSTTYKSGTVSVWLIALSSIYLVFILYITVYMSCSMLDSLLFARSMRIPVFYLIMFFYLLEICVQFKHREWFLDFWDQLNLERCQCHVIYLKKIIDWNNMEHTCSCLLFS